MVLSAQWHTPDNWYGSNDRVLVEAQTKGELNKYKSALKKYVKDTYNAKVTAKEMDFKNDVNDFVTYMYVSMGPSWSCTNHIITLDDLSIYK